MCFRPKQQKAKIENNINTNTNLKIKKTTSRFNALSLILLFIINNIYNKRIVINNKIINCCLS